MKNLRSILFSLLLSGLLVFPLRAQEPSDTVEVRQTIRLFMDCGAPGCRDLDYLRTEIPFVNWVRDIQDSEVYVLITALGTGGGGASTELVFTGMGPFEGMADTLTHISGFDATADEQRAGIARIMKIGLMRFVGMTPMAEEIDIRFRHRVLRPGDERAPGAVTAPEDDKWDFWVFRVRGSGGLNGYTNYKSRRFSGSLSASRTTEDWKTSLSLSSSYSDTRYDYPDLDYYRLSVRRSQTFNGSLTKSMGPNWSAGLKGSARSATYYNFDFSGSLAPLVEYSVFPYDEATQRSLTFQYALESVYNDYRDETVFFKEEESFLTQSLSASLRLTRPWGSAFAATEGAHHLDNIDLHHVTVFGGFQFRLGRGLSLTLTGDVSRVKDLVSVARDADATIEEVLLRRRQFQTDYRYGTSISISYSFGSIFNNVVNPRLGGGGFGIPMMIY